MFIDIYSNQISREYAEKNIIKYSDIYTNPENKKLIDEFIKLYNSFDLKEGERKIIDTGYLVAMEGTCKLEVVIIKGIKNVIFGGEGLFNAVVTGPGKVYIHSMPIEKTAAKVYYALPHHIIDSSSSSSSSSSSDKE